jgi:AsmA protein
VQPLKILGFVLGGLIALIACLLIAVKLFVNPNDYKGRITQAVKHSTGRDLTLAGDIKLAVFPWVGLDLGAVSLGNPPGFEQVPFATVKHAAVRVKLLPLLRKQLDIGRVEIDGLDLRLIKNAAGRGNWQDFGGEEAAPGSAAPGSSTSGPQTLPDLAGLIVTDSRVSFQDMVADRINLNVGHVASGVTVPIDLKAVLSTGPGAQPLPIAGKLEFTPATASKQYRIANLDLKGTMVPAPRTAPVSWKFAVPELILDLTAQTLKADGFTAHFAGARLSGSLEGNHIVDAPALGGSFKLEPLPVRGFMEGLAMTAPVTRDPKALSRLAASGEFTYGGNALGADKLNIQLDDSTLTGKAAVTNLDTKAIDFDLAVDRIDVDRYLSPAPAKMQAAPKAPEKPAAVPTSGLKSLLLHGTLSIGSATVAGMNLRQVLFSLDAKDGVAHLAPVKAQLYGGDYAGEITVDSREATPALQLNQRMSGIDVGQLLNDLAKSRRLSGRGNVTSNLTARGADSDTILKSLNGHVDTNLANGAVEGIDLWFEINRAMSLIQKQTLPSGSSSGRTRFDTFKASADLNSGVATTKDLNIASQNLHVTGQGASNLVTEAINYQLRATLYKDSSGANTKTLAEIPVTVTGTMSNPKVSPDLGGIAKARVQQELDKHKDQLKQQVQDKLQGLFK